MQVSYTQDAFASLIALVNFIEANNTNGAGVRWLNKFEQFILDVFGNVNNTRLCSNKTFETLHLRCVYFNDWAIAFSIHGNGILIEAILHKSRITD